MAKIPATKKKERREKSKQERQKTKEEIKKPQALLLSVTTSTGARPNIFTSIYCVNFGTPPGW